MKTHIRTEYNIHKQSSDPTKFWDFSRSKRGKSGIPDFMASDIDKFGDPAIPSPAPSIESMKKWEH